MTFRFRQDRPIVDAQGRPTTEFMRALPEFVQAIVTAQLAVQAAATAQTAANTAQSTATTAQTTAQAANDNANSRQPASSSLTALAALNSTGLVEQTGPNAFTDRAIGVAAASSIPTTADADARYVRQGQTSQPSYSTYTGQTVGAAYTQSQVQQIDDKTAAASAAIATIISKLHSVGVW
jgi:hypothetical protein